jgi:hypothetical protein
MDTDEMREVVDFLRFVCVVWNGLDLELGVGLGL